MTWITKPAAQAVFAAALILAMFGGATPVRAQVTLPLTVNGTLTITNGGSNNGIVQYTNGLVQAGSNNVTIALSASYPTLVIRGGKAAGATCANGGECWSTDFCEDSKCCCNCSPGPTVINGISTTTCYGSQYSSSGSTPIAGTSPTQYCTTYAAGIGNPPGNSFLCGNCAACNGANGTCVASSTSRSSSRANAVCRPAQDLCDAPESCNGTSMTCPTDGFIVAGTQCRAASGLGCDIPAQCTGTGIVCPPNPFIAGGTQCAPQNLAQCRNIAYCTGNSNACPPGALLPSGTLCQNTQGACGLPGRCDGATPSCPNLFLAAGMVCDPGTGATCTGSAASCPSSSSWSNQTCQ
jgi:hypothetical protein